jgi:hypothetical protein
MLLLFAFVQLIGCVIAGVVLSQTTNDGDYLTYGGGGSAALWLLLVIAYVRLQTSSVFILHFSLRTGVVRRSAARQR